MKTIEANNEGQDNQGKAGAVKAPAESGSTGKTENAETVSAEVHNALLKKMSEQDAKIESLLKKFDEISPVSATPAPAPVVISSSTVQSEKEFIKKRYDEQYRNATPLDIHEQAIYYCYLWAYPVLGYQHHTTREFINPPFIKTNGKPDEIVFVAHATQKDRDPIDGDRPVPYAMYRVKYKEEVEFLENHPDFGSLFYKHQGGSVKRDDLKAATLKAAIGAQINTMSPNGIGQKCQEFGIVFDPHNLREARTLLLDAMFKSKIDGAESEQLDEVMKMFAGANRIENIDGTPVAVQDLSVVRNLVQ